MVLIPFLNEANSKWMGDLIDSEDEGHVDLGIGDLGIL